ARRPRPRPDRKDAATWEEPLRRRLEGHRWEPKRASALVTVLDDARHGVAATEQACGLLDVACEQGVADPRRAPEPSIDGHRLRRVDREAVPCPELTQRLHIARPV